MRRGVGYTLVIFGLIILTLGVKPVHTQAVNNIPILASIDPIFLLGIGIVLLVLGVIIMRGSNSRKQAPEVPIYHGKEVVGYRRMSKK